MPDFPDLFYAVEELTAEELERIAIAEALTPLESNAVAELARRARAVEELEPLLVPITRAANRTRAADTKEALERIADLLRSNSRMRREILRGMKTS